MQVCSKWLSGTALFIIFYKHRAVFSPWLFICFFFLCLSPHASLTTTIWIRSFYHSISVTRVSLRSLVTLATCIITISLLLFISLCLLYSWHDPHYWHRTFDKQFVCLSLPPQDTQSIGVLPDDSESVLMDDTSSQWSAAADTEEERKSALEKSMYVFQTSLNLCPMAIRAVVHSLNKCVVSNSNIFECSCS